MKCLQNVRYTLSALLLIAVFGLVSGFARADSNDLMLNIPSLSIRTLIVEIAIMQLPSGEASWDTRNLGMQVGHLEGTAGLYETGNIVLGAHSELEQRRQGIFYTLNQIEIGDAVELVRDTETREYVVTQAYLVDIQDLSPVYPTSNDQITLITCDINSYDSATGEYHKRLIVVAERR